MANAITVKALQDASLDAKSLEEVVNGNDAKQVTTRLGETYPSVKKSIKTLFENGGLPTAPFATQALMTASSLVNGKYAMVTDDTANNGLYIKTAGAWVKSAYDPVGQSKDYTSSLPTYKVDEQKVIDASRNIYKKADDTVDLYINKTSSTISNCVGTRMFKVAVSAGESYTFNDINDLWAVISFSKTGAATSGSPVTKAVVDSSYPSLKKVIVPSGYSYMFVNTKIPAASFDVTDSLVINKNKALLVEYQGADIADTTARADIAIIDSTAIKNTDIVFNGYKENIATVDILGKYISAYESTNYGAIASTPTAALRVFPVTAGESYAVYSTSFTRSFFTVAVDATAEHTLGKKLTPLDLSPTSNPNVKTFTVPTGMSFGFATTAITSLGFDVRDEFWVNQGVTTSKFDIRKVTEIKGAQPYDSSAHARIDAINSVTPSILTGKTWVAVGDSITEFNMRATKNYHDFVSEDVGGMVVINKGVSGSGFHDRPDVADEITTDSPDLITIMWGTNDFGLVRNNYPLGTFLSTDMETIAGRMKYTIEKLINKYPLAKFAFISALPRLTNYGSNAAKNAQGYNLKDHVEMFERYAKHYSVPFLNLYEQSNLPVWIPAANEYYFTAPTLSTPDGLHPNDAGQRIMADKIRHFLESI